MENISAPDEAAMTATATAAFYFAILHLLTNTVKNVSRDVTAVGEVQPFILFQVFTLVTIHGLIPVSVYDTFVCAKR